MNILKTLDLLDDWKKLPAYKAEPRVDFIVAGALPEILQRRYGCKVNIIIPELPIRIGSIYENIQIDKSYKVDFYVNLENEKHLFIEFKTDSNSRRIKQDKYLLASQEVGMKVILEGIIKINAVTTYKNKYNYLINKLIDAKLIWNDKSSYKPIISHNQIEILYIQPKAKNTNEIGFNEVSNIMNESEDIFYKRFSEILSSWSND